MSSLADSPDSPTPLMRGNKSTRHQTLGSWWVMQVDGHLFWEGLPHHRAFQRQLSSSGGHKGPGSGAEDPGPLRAVPYSPPACTGYREPRPLPSPCPAAETGFHLTNERMPRKSKGFA